MFAGVQVTRMTTLRAIAAPSVVGQQADQAKQGG